MAMMVRKGREGRIKACEVDDGWRVSCKVKEGERGRGRSLAVLCVDEVTLCSMRERRENFLPSFVRSFLHLFV